MGNHNDFDDKNKREKETYESNYGGVSFFVVLLQVYNERKIPLLAFAILKDILSHH